MHQRQSDFMELATNLDITCIVPYWLAISVSKKSCIPLEGFKLPIPSYLIYMSRSDGADVITS